MVVLLIAGVAKAVPVARMEPPTATSYQFRIPALAVAPKVTEPVPHLPAGMVEVTVGVAVTVAITGVRMEVQLPLAVCT